MRRLTDDLRALASSPSPSTAATHTLSRRQWLAAAGAMCSWQLATSLGFAQNADNSYASKEEAEQAIPFDELKPELRAKLLAIVDRPSLYRRLPVQSVACDHDLHIFLARHPEVVVNIWRLMGITNMTAHRVAKYTVEGNDGAGTLSRIDLVYGKPDLHLFYCEGSYEGPLFKRQLKGRSVMLLRSHYGTDRHNNPMVTDKLDLFLQVDNIGADLLAKTMQSTVGKTIDANFVESLKFLNRISDSAERNGPGMQNLAAKLDECEPTVRSGFADVCAVTHARAADRVASLVAPVQVTSDGRIVQPTSATRNVQR
jgi:hypothetical protein